MGEIFKQFWLHFGSQVGAMLAIFRLKWGRRELRPPSSVLRWRFNSASFAILTPFWCHFGSMWAPLASILAIFVPPWTFWIQFWNNRCSLGPSEIILAMFGKFCTLRVSPPAHLAFGSWVTKSFTILRIFSFLLLLPGELPNPTGRRHQAVRLLQ